LPREQTIHPDEPVHHVAASSNRQTFRDRNRYLQLIELLLEATLELFQVAQTVELAARAEIHDAEHDDPIVIDVAARLPRALQGNLSLDGSDTAEPIEQLLLEGKTYFDSGIDLPSL
jgi:hypothetical protein